MVDNDGKSSFPINHVNINLVTLGCTIYNYHQRISMIRKERFEAHICRENVMTIKIAQNHFVQITKFDGNDATAVRKMPRGSWIHGVPQRFLPLQPRNVGCEIFFFLGVIPQISIISVPIPSLQLHKGPIDCKPMLNNFTNCGAGPNNPTQLGSLNSMHNPGKFKVIKFADNESQLEINLFSILKLLFNIPNSTYHHHE